MEILSRMILLSDFTDNLPQTVSVSVDDGNPVIISGEIADIVCDIGIFQEITPRSFLPKFGPFAGHKFQIGSFIAVFLFFPVNIWMNPLRQSRLSGTLDTHQS